MMTSKQIQIVKRNLLAAQISYRRSELNEESLYVELHNFFQRLKTQVLKEFEEYWNDDFMLQAQADLILAPVHEAQREYAEILQKHIEKEFYTGKATAKRYVALAQKKAKRDSLIKAANKAQTKVPINGILKRERELFGTSEHAGQKLANQSFTASEKTMSRIDGSINKILTDGYKEGWGQNKVAADLEKRFEQLKTWEARRIARTEIHNAHNEGINQTYVDMNVSYTQWGATQDDRTRGLKPSDSADHVSLDGEIIPFGGTYSNGLAYPGDTSGPIEEWINCRCVNLPFIIPDGYIAPPFSPFREDDLVAVEASNFDELIEQATEQFEDALPTTERLKSTLTKEELEQVNWAKSVLSKDFHTPKMKQKAQATLDELYSKANGNTIPKSKEVPLLQGDYRTYTEKLKDGTDVHVREYENGFKLRIEEGHNITHEDIVQHLQSLPTPLIEGIKLKHISFYVEDTIYKGGYSDILKHIKLSDTPNTPISKILDNLNHELAHAFDYQRAELTNHTGLSTREVYDKIFIADNKLGKKYTNPETGEVYYPERFPSEYAKTSWHKSKKEFAEDLTRWENRVKDVPRPQDTRYSEDFAESSRLYLNPKTHNKFVKEFPNRAKYLEGLYGKLKTVETPKTKIVEETPAKPKKTIADQQNAIYKMPSEEIYQTMTKADKKKYDKLKSKLDNIEKQIQMLGENPLLLQMKKERLLAIKQLELKQKDKLAKKLNPKITKDKTKKPIYERTLDNIHEDIEIPTEELIPKLEKWIKKRCKNTAEFGYNFNIKTGEFIGEEIRGKKGHVTITDLGEGTGTIHSHPRNGMAVPSVADLESFRCEKGQHHFMVAEHEIWYVKATDSFGIGGMGQQLDLQKAHKKCKDIAYERVAKEIKENKIEATEDAIAFKLNEYTGDEVLKTFNSPPWNKTMIVKRYYI